MRRRTTRPSLAWLLAALTAAASGCAGVRTAVWGACFSPDGTTLAYVQEESAGLDFSSGLARLRRCQYVRWAGFGSAAGRQAVMVAEGRAAGPGGEWEYDSVRELVFAPDGRHLAIRTKARIRMLNVARKQVWTLTPPVDGDSGLLWLSPHKLLVWTVATVEGPDSRRARLRIFRQGISAGERPEVLHEQRHRLEDWERQELYRVSASPDGRHVAFARSRGSQAKVLAVATGRVSAVGPPGWALAAAAWRPDGSAVFCELSPPGPSAASGGGAVAPRAVLVEVGKSIVVHPMGEFARQKSLLRVVGPTWTADGKYVIADDGRGMALIRPRPWKIHRLQDKAFEEWAFLPGRRGEPMGALPVPGWVWGRRGRTVYAVDYNCRHRIVIARQEQWGVSPDGRRIFEAGAFGRPKLRELKLPALRAGES